MHGGGQQQRELDLKTFLLPGAAAGVLELAIFHPIDTIGKRLMNQSTAQKLAFRQIVFPTLQGGQSILSRNGIGALYPGFGYGFVYKVAQRTYKFGFQPVVRRQLPSHWPDVWRHGLAGSIIGAGEVLLLPMDALKVKAQTGTLRSVDLAPRNVLSLYRGATWTAARNIPGSFALFAGKNISDTYLMRGRNRTAQHMVGSVVGSVASIVISSPLDVVKTRIQAQNESGVKVCAELYRTNGVRGFFWGIGPKTLAVAPKLIFSFFVASVVTDKLVEYLDRKEAAEAAAATTAATANHRHE